MKYLVEREAGFDADRIGFPSISGCLAVCLVTDDGLFGFHNAGGSGGKDDFKARADLFRDYVLSRGPLPKGRALYGCSFVGDNRRGYGGPTGKGEKNLKAELEVFATKLGFGGKIYGYDLTKLNTTTSAYVEYQHVGIVCRVFAKPWTEENKVTAVNPGDPDHHCIRGQQYTNVVTAIDNGPMVEVVPKKL